MLPALNEKRIDKLEQEMNEMHKTVKVDLKELKNDLKETIDDGFAQCRIVQPLKCQAINKNKFGVGTIIALCTAVSSIICGVVIFLVKSGLLDTAVQVVK